MEFNSSTKQGANNYRARHITMLSRLVSMVRLALVWTGIFVLLVSFTPLVKWAGTLFSTGWNDSNGDVLVLLGSSTVTYEGSSVVLGEDTYWRVVYAIYVWRHGHFRTMLLCGERSDESVKPFLVANGVPESAILVENRSRSTHENALFAKPILAGLSGHFVLLTSDYHTFRASRCFAHEGIAVTTRPCPDLLKRAASVELRWNCFWTLVRELCKIGYYRAHGWI